MKVKLTEVTGKLEMINEMFSCYYNIRTGEFIEVEDENFVMIEDGEDGEDLLDWQKENLKQAMDIYDNPDKYIALPNQYDVNDYDIMQSFCYRIDDEKTMNILLNAIHGSGAFRRFKDLIFQLNIEDDWYDFKYLKLSEIAKEWCEDNNIEYVDDVKVIKSSIYRKNYHIDISDVDFNKQLKLSTLFSHFQDTASEAVDKLGIGINTIEQKYGVSWILIRMRVEIMRHPKCGEDITIETWPLEPKTLEFERDFLVYDKKGNVIIKAISTWIILDIKARRIKRSETLPSNYPKITKRAIDYKLKKLKSFDQLEIAYKKMIGYSDIDFNGHLNNSKYIDFITDCFTFENHQAYIVKTIDINFINEALPGEIIELFKDVTHVDEGVIYIEGINEENKQANFKAKVAIVPR